MCPSQFSRLPQMAVANSLEIDGRIAILYCTENLTVYSRSHIRDALTAI